MRLHSTQLLYSPSDLGNFITCEHLTQLELAAVAGQGAHPEDRGIFLVKSYRMHPEVCAFISEIVYAGRLHPDESAAQRATSGRTGIRFVPVEHEGNRAAADEEVAEIGKLIATGNVYRLCWLNAPAAR